MKQNRTIIVALLIALLPMGAQAQFPDRLKALASPLGAVGSVGVAASAAALWYNWKTKKKLDRAHARREAGEPSDRDMWMLDKERAGNRQLLKKSFQALVASSAVLAYALYSHKGTAPSLIEGPSATDGKDDELLKKPLHELIAHQMQGIKIKDSVLPIMYSNGYVIDPTAFFGRKKRYQDMFELLSKSEVKDRIQFIASHKVTGEHLKKTHDHKYINRLTTTPDEIQKVFEIREGRLKSLDAVRTNFLNPVLHATGGTVLGAEIAAKTGKLVINLGGGYHHAMYDRGHGFCPVNDAVLAAQHLLETNDAMKKVMIIDLDVHQGNGNALVKKHGVLPSDDQLVIYDVYNKDNFPREPMISNAAQFIKYNRPIPEGTGDTEYFNLLESNDRGLKAALKKENPDFIIYNSGTDPYERDKIGGVKITKNGIIKRDALVVSLAQEMNIPVLWLLSGGYSRDGEELENANLVVDSIKSIVTETLKLPTS